MTIQKHFYTKNGEKTLPFDIFENLCACFFPHTYFLRNHIPGFHQPFSGESCLLQFCWFLRCSSQNQIDPEHLHHYYPKEKQLLKQMCCQVNGLKVLHDRYHSLSSHRPRWSSKRNIDHLNTTVDLTGLRLTGDSSESHSSGAQQWSIPHTEQKTAFYIWSSSYTQWKWQAKEKAQHVNSEMRSYFRSYFSNFAAVTAVCNPKGKVLGYF